MVVSAVTLLVTSVLRTLTYKVDISLKKVTGAKHYWIAQSYEQYALWYVYNNSFQTIKNSLWLTPHLYDNYSGEIQLHPHASAIEVLVEVKKLGDPIYQTTAQYALKFNESMDQKSMTVSNWRTHETF